MEDRASLISPLSERVFSFMGSLCQAEQQHAAVRKLMYKQEGEVGWLKNRQRQMLQVHSIDASLLPVGFLYCSDWKAKTAFSRHLCCQDFEFSQAGGRREWRRVVQGECISWDSCDGGSGSQKVSGDTGMGIKSGKTLTSSASLWFLQRFI